MRMFTLEPRYLTVSRKPNDDYIGRVITDTICNVGEKAVGRSVKVDCFDPLNLGPGTAIVRLEAKNIRILTAGRLEFEAAANRVHSNRLTVTNAASSARPTWARTAPLTGVLLGAEAALLLPAFNLRRRRDDAAATDNAPTGALAVT
jgi:hypothetical protein